MKKMFLICGLSAALVVLPLTACGGQQPDQPTEPDPAPVTQTAPVPEPVPEPVSEPEPEEPPAAPIPEPAGEQLPAKSPEAVELFSEANETVYATGTVNIRESYSADSAKLGSLSAGQSVTRTGIGVDEASGWSRVALADGTTAYINNNYLSTTKPVVQQIKPSGNQNGGEQTATQQPQTPAQPSQPSTPSGGLSAEDQAAIDAIIAEQGGVIGRQWTDEEVRNGGTHSSTDVIYR